MTIQGHPRSLILAPVESMYGNSYWSLIITLVLWCPVSERAFELQKPLFSIPHPQFWPTFQGVPFEVDP